MGSRGHKRNKVLLILYNDTQKYLNIKFSARRLLKLKDQIIAASDKSHFIPKMKSMYKQEKVANLKRIKAVKLWRENVRCQKRTIITISKIFKLLLLNQKYNIPSRNEQIGTMAFSPKWLTAIFMFSSFLFIRINCPELNSEGPLKLLWEKGDHLGKIACSNLWNNGIHWK